MSNKKAIVTTAVEQSFFVLGKDQFTVAGVAYYPDGKNQAPYQVVEPLVVGEGTTRINSLHTLVQIIASIPTTYTRYINVYVNGAVASNYNGLANEWIRKFKQAQWKAAVTALGHGVEAEDVSYIEHTFRMRGREDVTIQVTGDEIALWEALNELMADRPFINIRNVSSASNSFRDSRTEVNEERVKAGWDALVAIGADIKQQEQDEVIAADPGARLTLNIGAAAAVAAEAIATAEDEMSEILSGGKSAELEVEDLDAI